jgi:prolipoprotein diacylglyceryltransferase
LIEALFEAGVTVVVSWLLLRKTRPGVVAFGFLFCYSIFRIALEVYRFDRERGFLFGGVVSTSQFISGLLIVVAVAGLWRMARQASPAT